MRQAADRRARAVRTASRLFQEQGYHGTGLAQILAESGAPKGSFYYYFPGGKEQLALEAIADANREMGALFAHAERGGRDAVEYVRLLARALARWIARSAFTEGCPIASLTLETAHVSEALRVACRASYDEWQDRIAGALTARGLRARDARGMASMLVAGMNGAMILCRAERSTAPFRHLERELGGRVAALRGRGAD